MYVVKRVSIFIALLATTSMINAQATPTAARRGDLQVGVGFSDANSDAQPERYKGFALYSDFDFKKHWGAEAEFHIVKDPTPAGRYEKTYEIGGRYFQTYGRFVPYAKLMVGRGVFNYANNTANLAYNMWAGGIGLDYRIKSYLNARGDFEYQNWSGFPPHGLTPTMYTVGVAYHFN
jgi:hypothetical protein